MKKEIISSYLEGMMNLASSLSDAIGPSYIKVECYEKDKFREEFCKDYEISPTTLNLIDTPNSLQTTLLDWFGNNNKIVESISYWFDLYYKGLKKIYLAEEKLISILNNKKQDFYFLEDMFFIEYNDYMIIFLLGNNE